jgi:hypothetical protein
MQNLYSLLVGVSLVLLSVIGAVTSYAARPPSNFQRFKSSLGFSSKQPNHTHPHFSDIVPEAARNRANATANGNSPGVLPKPHKLERLLASDPDITKLRQAAAHSKQQGMAQADRNELRRLQTEARREEEAEAKRNHAKLGPTIRSGASIAHLSSAEERKAHADGVAADAAKKNGGLEYKKFMGSSSH